VPHAEEILDAAFELLGEDVVIAHARDVKNTGEVVAAGRGELDYDWYLENLRGFGFEGPLILHNLEEGEVEGSVSFLRTNLERIQPVLNSGEVESAPDRCPNEQACCGLPDAVRCSCYDYCLA
jgi:hypothetical protein